MNDTIQSNLIQDSVGDLFVVAQTLVGFSTLGFVILLTILGLLPTFYRIQTGPMPEVEKIVALMENPPFRVLSKFNEMKTLLLLSSCSSILIVSGVFGFIYFLYHDVIYLIIGCVISITSISLMGIFIVYIFIDLWHNAHYYKRDKIDVIVNYITVDSVTQRSNKCSTCGIVATGDGKFCNGCGGKL